MAPVRSLARWSMRTRQETSRSYSFSRSVTRARTSCSAHAELWPQAQALGVSRSTFDAATRGVEPDLTLPDLDLPGREGPPPRGQAEFVQTPADYIKESNISYL